MYKTRRGVFETNSSSTHTFSINNTYSYKLKKEIRPSWHTDFGWAWEIWETPEEKLAYILRCLTYQYSWLETREIIKKVQVRLHKLGVHFDLPTDEEWRSGSIDHGDKYETDIKEIIDKDKDFLNFLFNDKCYIEGGNDNE